MTKSLMSFFRYSCYIIILSLIANCSKKTAGDAPTPVPTPPPTITPPVVSTLSIQNITKNSALLSGSASEIGQIIEFGFYWDTISNVTVSSNKVIASNGGASFTTSISGLKSYKLYYIAAYVKTSTNTYLGNIVSFKTIGKTYIPDDNFEQYLISIGLDDVLDDSVITNKIDTVTVIKLSQPIQLNNLLPKPVSNLTGIQDFKNLKELWCANQSLTSLDISSNISLQKLQCPNNKLTTLDVTKNINLTFLDFWDNLLNSIDVTNNINLQTLGIGVNNISKIDISKNIALTEIDFQSGILTSLDLSKNINLQLVYVMRNKLTNLDVSNNPKITNLWAQDNLLPSLTLSNNLLLTDLHLDNNKISSLDISLNSRLLNVTLPNNNLQKLTIGPDLPFLDASKNPNLFCIQTSDPVGATNKFIINKRGSIDTQTTFNVKCN